MRRADLTKALLDTVDHHVADHLAGDAGRRGDPADNLAIMAVEGKGEAHDLAVPAGELECVRAPPMIGADRRDLAIMLARPPASGMAFEQETVLLHQSVDALGVDRGRTIGWPRVDKATDRTGELNIARSLLRPATSSGAVALF